MRREEKLALGVAVVAHAALIAALTLSPPGKSIKPPPQRMVVTIADEVADKATSPEPNAQTAPDVAPALGEQQQAAEPETAPPAPVEKVQPAPPPPAPVERPQPRPEPPRPAPPKPQPKPQPVVRHEPRPEPRPQPRPEPRPQARPAPPKPAPARPAPARPAPVHTPAKPAPRQAEHAPGRDKPAPTPPRKAPQGGDRIGKDFLAGLPSNSNPGASHNPPAQTAGPDVRASLGMALSRQIKPHWQGPSGVEVDKLVTVVAWNLNPDGSLAGKPVIVSQSGITDANRAQAHRHAELAIRAVELAAPFNLPPQYYNSWKRVSAFRFDWKLSQ
ncbi:outer membrane biosynthesis protein TonB [Novosphingobium capsulatum]|uniref:Outer membrane biosynthesis protein TonB n=1 Tax=Novosphingobium capsulatum TaxID=13688 RepID=A0ABU1MJ49_9SPHN|nr:outer membrane biosynthesis protein TonB [Novosphingobium capsulatum]